MSNLTKTLVLIFNILPYLAVTIIILASRYNDQYIWLKFLDINLSKNMFLLFLFTILIINVFYFLKILSSKILAIVLASVTVIIFLLFTFYVFTQHDNYMNSCSSIRDIESTSKHKTQNQAYISKKYYTKN